jgi:hypothetical protein
MSKTIYNEEENTIILWKENKDGLYQLVFDEYNQVTYMFIGNDGRKVRNTFEFNFEELKQIKNVSL